MATFQIQNADGTLSPTSHNEFFDALNSSSGYLYYKRGGKHLALLPTEESEETIRICRQADNAENYVYAKESRCRDAKGHLCRFQHDENGNIIRNADGKPVSAKCGECPRNGWAAGKRENCCIRNYCMIADCSSCMNHREYHAPISIEWLAEGKYSQNETDGTGFCATDPNADIQAAIERNELNTALHNAIEQLPMEEQLVLRAIYWGGLSQRSYAAENGMTKSTVNRIYKKALASLKNILKDFC